MYKSAFIITFQEKVDNGGWRKKIIAQFIKEIFLHWRPASLFYSFMTIFHDCIKITFNRFIISMYSLEISSKLYCENVMLSIISVS